MLINLSFLGQVGGYNLKQGGGGQTVLRRESNGNVTVLSLRRTFVAALTRQPNGNVIVGAA